MAENFFSISKSECINRQRIKDFATANELIDEYIHFHNHHRNFSASKPNEKWVTDVTEFAFLGQKLYFSPILDLYNGEIISYNLSNRPNFWQVVNMLDKAFAKISDGAGLVLHSDQGWQYQMKQYQLWLQKKGVIQSMSRRGNCLDNAVMENCFGLLKSELFYL